MKGGGNGAGGSRTSDRVEPPPGPADPGDPPLAGQVDLAFRLLPRNLLASAAASTMVAFLFAPFSGSRVMLVWWLGLSLVTAVRYGFVLAQRNDRLAAARARAWARRAVLTSGLAGAFWGIAVSLLAPPWGSGEYVLAVFMVAGVPAAALVASAAVFASYAAFAVPILLPYAFVLLTRSSSLAETLGGLAALVYLSTLVAIARASNRQIVEGLRLRSEKKDLVEKLSAANEELRAEVERRGEAESVMRRAKEAAEAASLAKTRFLAKMSHELRTPLNGVLGQAEILHSTDLTPEQRRLTRSVGEEGRALLQIIDDILDVSRVEAGRLKLDPSDFQLRDLVERTASLQAEPARAKGVELTWRLGDDVPERAHGDPGRLRQILVNLLGNAVKFTEEGSVGLDVGVEPGGDRNHLRFVVRDTGIGIQLDLQRRLFEPFVQADDSPSRRAGGTGLGLAICRQLAALMGGEIGLVSAPGEGSRFWFTVRLSPPRDETGTTGAGGTAGSQEARGSLSGSVLLVEDNPVNREVALAHLSGMGLVSSVAEDGPSALALLAQRRFDVVLMDCQLPGMDGHDVTRAIRKAETEAGLPPVPIVALTAGAMEEDRVLALGAGMDGYLSKPFTRAQLFGALSRWLGDAAPDGLHEKADDAP